MEKKALFWGMAVALLFSACQPKNQPEAIADGALKGTIEQPVVEGFGAQTRAGFGESFAFNWQAGDKIMVLTSAGSKAFMLQNGAGTATGTFVGSLGDGELVSDKVASPYNSNHTLNANSTSMTLPAEYNYGSNTTFTTIPVMLPCWAPIEANAFSMSHLVGYMAFEISNIPAGANKFVLTTEDKRINGAVTADLTAGTPIFAAVDAANDAEKTVTINFTASAEVTTHCFVVPVPVGTYTYDWYIKADNALKGFGNGENVAVGRGQIKGCRVACAEIGGGEPEPEPEPEPEVQLHNGHGYVDLGLPSGTMWATCNIGATLPEETGLYFAWGETVGYRNGSHSFDYNNYRWWGTFHGGTFYTKYHIENYDYGNPLLYNHLTFLGDGKEVLDLGDDAAHVNWGGNWKMPTVDQINELYSKCTWTVMEYNGITGFKVASKAEGNTNWIFLPASGNIFTSNQRSRYNESGFYLSNTIYTRNIDQYSDRIEFAWALHFTSSGWNMGYCNVQYSYRVAGASIRPVCQ